MPTFKASQDGLAKVKQRRNELGWAVSNHRWLELASQILGINWDEKGYLANGISEGTWSRFLAGKRINAPAFKAYCQVLGLSWEEVVSSIEAQDWDSAPDASVFYGRTEELSTLEQWIVENHCRAIALLGMGGIGKTALSVKLAQQIQDEFEYLIWRSLRNAPPIENFLIDLLEFFSRHNRIDLSQATEGKFSQLMECLQKHRCLLILDNWETVLSTGELAGQTRFGYEGYGELLRRGGESHHNSCFLLTSWEKPREIAAIESPTSLVRSFYVNGLGEAAKDILKEQGLSEEPLWSELIKPYRGNPLALKIVAATIQDLFAGSVSEFLVQNTLFLGDFEHLLYQQYQRISPLEKEVMYRLAGNTKSVSVYQLREQLHLEVSLSELLKVLESLERRSLIKKIKEDTAILLTLQPLVMKYVNKQSARI